MVERDRDTDVYKRQIQDGVGNAHGSFRVFVRHGEGENLGFAQAGGGEHLPQLRRAAIELLGCRFQHPVTFQKHQTGVYQLLGGGERGEMCIRDRCSPCPHRWVR